LSETSYADLPPAARQRLGMDEAHKNVLVRITIRPFDRTLTGIQANTLRDRIYDVIHQGTAGQWATR
jgi:phenylalanyl-tRNA synthetase alpha chain